MSSWDVEIVALGPLLAGTLRELRADLARGLARPVRIAASPLSLDDAFDPARRQYSAQVLLELLRRRSPPPGLRLLGVTRVDLFLPVFTHVFGAAQLGGPAAVVSCHRLRGTDVDPGGKATAGRLLREALHELGHTAGLIHCRCSWCSMAPSRTPEEVDLKDAGYCPQCARRLGMT
ncbi:MAG: peptidase M54 [Acidobacteriota bacterium]|nr:peptidase M54 [Acidobacteriota bacterium]MDQ7086374.1 peptidase M54 [Acidobacteriota bacterium]